MVYRVPRPRESTPATRLLGRRVRTWRQEQGLTQEDLAHRAECTLSAVTDLERGLANPTWKSLLRFAHALDTTVAELADGITLTSTDNDNGNGNPT